MSPKYTLPLAAAITGIATVAVVVGGLVAQAGRHLLLPEPVVDETVEFGYETAVFSGGCFWGVQAVFQHTQGVVRAVAGYAGGEPGEARYDLVSLGETGHAESVEVTFNPAVVSYGKLLQIFFSVAHDPTQWNRQGPDVGVQYRSALYPTSEEQAVVAKAYIEQLSHANAYEGYIVTKVAPLDRFYRAEDYHQDYVNRHPDRIYVMMNDLPKLAALKDTFPDMWLEKPTLVLAASS